MTNALVHEKSPYLRQHSTNPVEWLPWGEAAFEKARRENKPIFLSIGYSTCHWCHVMAHESFESEETADVLNRFFVPIKLDREERPDVDRIYMLFVQATTGSGGWPMSVWLTPDLKPFYGGTYYPPLTKYGRPGFRDLLLHLARAWDEDRANIETSSASVFTQLQSLGSATNSDAALSEDLFLLGSTQLARSYDERFGGFGNAPKFPRPVSLTYLLRAYTRTQDRDTLDMVIETLKAMAKGGMHDQIGGGFHRYSVDERWFVPHFEKMLYDQAQLAIAYLEAFQITGDSELARVARGILDYVARDMTDPDGGFYSAEDADSPDPEDPQQHGEGAFYIWRKGEIDAVLGAASADFCRFYGVKADGNVENDPHLEFAGRNILYRSSQPEPAALAEAAAKLFAVRAKRPRPHLDNKVLASWNGLMISAFARAAGVLGEPSYLAAAERSAQFLLRTMYDRSTGKLLRRYCEGEAAVSGFADDYAFVAQGLLDLFEATGSAEYLEVALDLASRGLSRFEDEQAGGFFSTEQGASDVLLRLKDDYDGAEPSANSVAADVLLRLAHLTGEESFQQRAERTLRDFAPKLRSQPTMAPQMASALGRWLAAPEQVVLRYEQASELTAREVQTRRKGFSPYRVLLELSDRQSADLHSLLPFLGSLQRRATVELFECRNLVCDLPVVLG